MTAALHLASAAHITAISCIPTAVKAPRRRTALSYGRCSMKYKTERQFQPREQHQFQGRFAQTGAGRGELPRPVWLCGQAATLPGLQPAPRLGRAHICIAQPGGFVGAHVCWQWLRTEAQGYCLSTYINCSSEGWWPEWTMRPFLFSLQKPIWVCERERKKSTDFQVWVKCTYSHLPSSPPPLSDPLLLPLNIQIP